MRIGLSTSVIQRGRTGVAQYVLALSRAYCAAPRDHEFTLFVLEEDQPLFAFAASCMEIVPVPESFRPALKNILWHQRVLPRLVREHELDVLHIPSYRRLLWPRPCALVATIHDLAPCRLAGKYDRARQIYGRWIARALARRQHEIIVISQNTSRDVAQFYGIPPEQTHVIYNGLDHERFSPGSRTASEAEAARRHNLCGRFFLYVARLEHPGKNHVMLVEAFNRFKSLTSSSWKLVLAGSDWNGAQAVHEACRRSPYREDIRLLGFVADDQLPDLYRAAGAFVYPSLYEGFGMPPCEAMACGCPVISSTGGALGEVVGKGGVLLRPEDQDGWVSAMARMATDPEWAEGWRESGLKRAAEFDWRQTAAATLDVYAQAATKVGNRCAGRSKPRRSGPDREREVKQLIHSG